MWTSIRAEAAALAALTGCPAPTVPEPVVADTAESCYGLSCPCTTGVNCEFDAANATDVLCAAPGAPGADPTWGVAGDGTVVLRSAESGDLLEWSDVISGVQAEWNLSAFARDAGEERMSFLAPTTDGYMIDLDEEVRAVRPGEADPWLVYTTNPDTRDKVVDALGANDLSGDDVPDFAVLTWEWGDGYPIGSDLALFHGPAPGRYTPTDADAWFGDEPVKMLGYIFAGDVNGDGVDDLLLTDAAQPASVFHGPVSGALFVDAAEGVLFQGANLFDSPTDLTGDGTADMVTSGFSAPDRGGVHGVTVWEGGASGPAVFMTVEESLWATAVDTEGDARPELIETDPPLSTEPGYPHKQPQYLFVIEPGSYSRADAALVFWSEYQGRGLVPRRPPSGEVSLLASTFTEACGDDGWGIASLHPFEMWGGR